MLLYRVIHLLHFCELDSIKNAFAREWICIARDELTDAKRLAWKSQAFTFYHNAPGISSNFFHKPYHSRLPVPALSELTELMTFHRVLQINGAV